MTVQHEMNQYGNRYHVVIFKRGGVYAPHLHKIMKRRGLSSHHQNWIPGEVQDQILDSLEQRGLSIHEFEQTCGGNIWDAHDVWYEFDEFGEGSVRWFWKD